MTNPNNAIGTNAAYGGRTSVDAFNDDLAIYKSRGVISGFGLSTDTGLTISVGGSGIERDVAIAEDNIGNKTTINNISGAPVSITIPAAPASNSRIDLVVAYVERPAQGTSTIADNYEACGLIVVSGTAAATPVAPNDSAIRTAIIADGASGSTAYYAVLGSVTIASGTTDISSNMLADGDRAVVKSDSVELADGSVNYSKLDSTTAPLSSTISAFGTYTMPSKGLLVVTAVWQLSDSGDSAYTITFSGNSGPKLTPQGSQYCDVAYVRGSVTAYAYVNAGDVVTIGRTSSNAADKTCTGFLIPCNWAS